jgi:flavin reductase (DIM6/NTAB) family NADH-FMN oxidoreductase RutF
MQIDLSHLEAREAHDLLTGAIIPRPIAWVSSISQEGQLNLAPFSFFNGVTWHPPTLCISVVNRDDGSRKDTVRNIEETGFFAVNMVREDMGDRMVATSVTVPRDVDEAQSAGVVLVPSEKILAPRVKNAQIAFECEKDRIVTIGAGPHAANLILGRILTMHVDDRLLASETRIDGTRSRLLGRLGGTKYCRIRSVVEILPPNEKTR